MYDDDVIQAFDDVKLHILIVSKLFAISNTISI